MSYITWWTLHVYVAVSNCIICIWESNIYVADIWTITSHTGMTQGQPSSSEFTPWLGSPVWSEQVGHVSWLCRALSVAAALSQTLTLPLLTAPLATCFNIFSYHLSLLINLNVRVELLYTRPLIIWYVQVVSWPTFWGTTGSFYPDAPIYQTMTCLNDSRVQSSCSLTTWSLFFWLASLISGFLQATQLFSPKLLSSLSHCLEMFFHL